MLRLFYNGQNIESFLHILLYAYYRDSLLYLRKQTICAAQWYPLCFGLTVLVFRFLLGPK